MKAKTYARLSLLLPIVLWGICLLYSLVMNSIAVQQLDSFLSIPIVDWIGQFIVFYVFGVIFWILPYILLSTILFVLTFKNQVKSLLYIFVLSPFAMAILMMVEAAIFSLIWPGVSTDTLDNTFLSSAGLYIVFALFSLVWGYICVGIGFGGYKLLQYFNIIKRERMTEAEPIAASSFEKMLQGILRKRYIIIQIISIYNNVYAQNKPGSILSFPSKMISISFFHYRLDDNRLCLTWFEKTAPAME